MVQLAAGEGEKILAAPALDEGQGSFAFSADLFGCKPPSGACEREHERELIDTAGGAVKRKGNLLSIRSAAGATAEFIDWSKAQTKTAEGDKEWHRYLGRLDGSGYHRVEVQFAHDSPGSYLINPTTGKTAFVHNGGDVVALSPDGLRVIVFNALNPPLALRLGVLDTAGPRLELHCAAPGDEPYPQFKGWRDAHTFDLVVKPKGVASNEAIPVRISQTAGGWTIATLDPARLITTVGFACRQ